MEVDIVISRTVLQEDHVVISHIPIPNRGLDANVSSHTTYYQCFDASTAQDKLEVRIHKGTVSVLPNDRF